MPSESTSQAPNSGAARRLALGVMTISAALLMTEIVLTRLFSVVLWYHFAFLAVSVALFGTAAAALVVHALRARLMQAPMALTASAAAFSISVLVDAYFLVRVAPAWFETFSTDLSLSLRLVITFCLTALPFVCAGLSIALALARAGEVVHRIYAWDLAGAGIGCLVVVFSIALLGGPGALLACAALGALAAWLFATSAGARALALATGVVAFSVLGAHFTIGTLQLEAAKGVVLSDRRVEWSGWNAHSMVAVLADHDFGGWGMSPTYGGKVGERKAVVIDMNALTALPRVDAAPSRSGAYLLEDLSALVHQLGPVDRVCVLGAGAGSDVLAALAAGARHVTAVELNRLIVDELMLGAFSDYTGGLYARDDVTVVVDDARNFVRRGDERYDRIVVSMVDTSAATAAGAFVLTENALYTINAFEDFLSALEPGGVLSVSSVSVPGLAVGARLTSLAREALLRRGADPARSIAVVATPWMGLDGAHMYNIMISPGGFDEAQINTLAVAAKTKGFDPVYLPGRSFASADIEKNGIAYLVRERDAVKLRVWYEALPLDITPVDDERPFFFYQERLQDFLAALTAGAQDQPFGNGLVFLARVLVASLLMLGLCLFTPLVLRTRGARTKGSTERFDLLIAALLGVGFMILEIATLQRITMRLGDPTASLAVVLCVLLLAGAAGSRLSATVRRRGALGWVYLLIVGGTLVLAYAMPPVLNALIGQPRAIRALGAALLVAPLGLGLGMPLPALLARAASTSPQSIPWLWAVNGSASVLGATLATLVSMHASIPASFLLAAACYAAAGLAFRASERPAG